MRSARPSWVIGMSALLVGAVVACGAPALADDVSSGLWYFERGHVQDAHDAGFTGEGVTVAVLDTQINPDVPTLRGANLEVVETSYCFDEAGEPLSPVSTDYTAASHGTRVAAMIVGTGASASGAPGTKGVAPGATVRYSAVGTRSADSNSASCLDESGKDLGPLGTADAMRDAIDAGADIVSVSFGSFAAGETIDQFTRALALGVIIVAALPNDLDNVTWPAVGNGVVAVQAFDANGQIQTNTGPGGKEFPNTTDDVEVAAPGMGILVPGSPTSWEVDELADGTSLATPIVSGFLAVAKSKYPHATGNQLIQSLIHTTGGRVDGEPQWGNDKGYGAVSLTAMLQVDPAKFPDTNPLIKTDPGAIPTVEEVEQARKESVQHASPPLAPSSDTVTPSNPPDAGWMPWVIGAILGVLVIVAAAIVLVSLSLRRRRADERRTATGGPTQGTSPVPGPPAWEPPASARVPGGGTGAHTDEPAPRG